MAFERRPRANHSQQLLQTLLERPLPAPGARLPPKLAAPRAARTDAEALALLQALLETPIAASERRGPVVLRSVESRLYINPYRSASQAWFDSLLQRSSQVLLVGAVLVLGYWVINVPVSNWLHGRRAPIVRASSALPSATAARIAATRVAAMPTLGRANVAPVLRGSAPPSAIKVPQLQASATPTATSTAPTAAPRAAAIVPTAVPTQAAAPPMISPTIALQWPTITPVQLGTVSKPSPAPAQPTPLTIHPAVAAGSNATSAMPTRLIIPALGLDVPIKEVFIVDDQWQVAEYAAGYLNGSGRPGVPGNLALDGHAGLYGAVFANLGALNPGDDIYTDAAGVRYHYRLRTSSAVWPNQADVLDSTETPTMTLITCTNWDTQRLVAQADFVDSGPALDG